MPLGFLNTPAEGSDAIGFLKTHLQRVQMALGFLKHTWRGFRCHWVSLNTPATIDPLLGRTQNKRRHIGCTAKKRKRRVILAQYFFKLLGYADHQAILKGAREAYHTTYDRQTLSFIPDYSVATVKKLMMFNDVKKKMTSIGLKPFPAGWWEEIQSSDGHVPASGLRKGLLLTHWIKQ